MDSLIAAGRGNARVVNVSSIGHGMQSGLTYPRQNSSTTYNRFVAYSDSKLANVLFSLEFERRYGEALGIHAYSLHPGYVATELARHMLTSQRDKVLCAPINFLCAKTSLQGAQTSLYCALDDTPVPGGYN